MRSFALSAVAVMLSPVLTVAEWKPLFNGADLRGWDTSRSQQWIRNGAWTVEDGAIVGRFDPQHPGPGWLLSKDQFGDFKLRLKFWISEGGNSGVTVRAPSGAANPARAGYEIQIKSKDQGQKNPTGSIYDVAAAKGGKIREEQWNDLEILCKGPVIQVRLNGEEVASANNERSLKGAVGFQIHGQKPHPDVAKFKDIQIETY